MNNIVGLIPNKTDNELAEEIKKELIEAYEPLILILDKAEKLGFNCNVQVGKNAFGKYQIVVMQLMKLF